MKRRVYLNLDANETVFFERELNYVKSRSYDVQYPALMARTLFPVDTAANTGAKTITYDTYDHVGMAKLIHNYAQDLPNVEVNAKQTTVTIYSLGIAFGYSLQDIRSSMMAGKSLDQRKANAARFQMAVLENDIAFYGDSSTSIPPFVNNPNTIKPTIPAGASTFTTWATKTPDEIIKDVQIMVTAIRDTTKGIEMPNTLCLPEAQYTHIATTPRSTVSDTTILSFILSSNPWVREIIPVWNLKGAGPTGQDVMILYDRSPDKLTLDIPQEVEFLPTQEKALMYEVPVHSRTAGVIVYYPKSIAQGNGI